MKALFLGTGGSTGIPMVGCSCSVCTSKDPKNKRLRPALLLTISNKTFLIDTGPDLREQALKYGIKHLDGVLLTHAHYDHIAGLDELRNFYLLKRQVLPLLLSASTFAEVKKKYDYFFEKRDEKKSLAAQLDFHVLPHKKGEEIFQGLTVKYMTYSQGGMEVTGFRFGSLAYVSDIKTYEESIFEELKDLDILIMSALRTKSSPVHLTIDEAVAFAKRVHAKKTYFMHIAHEIDHKTIADSLPSGIMLAYDGLELEFKI